MYKNLRSKNSFFLFFALLLSLAVFSQTPPHITATASITTYSQCAASGQTFGVTFTFTNTGETPATGYSIIIDNATGYERGDFSEWSATDLPPGGTIQKSCSYFPTNQVSDQQINFRLTCAEPGATFESGTMHFISLPYVQRSVSTQGVINITASSATLLGNVNSYGQCTSTSQGKFFRIYNLDDQIEYLDTPLVVSTVTGPYSYTLEGLMPGTHYGFQASVGDVDNEGSLLDFTTAAAVANDICANAAPLSVSAPPVQGSLANATNGDVFYSFTPTVTGTHYITIDNFGTAGNKNLYILNGCGGSTVGSGTSASLSSETAAASLVAGTTYIVQVVDADLHRDTFDIRIDPPHPALSTNGTSAITFADYYNDITSAVKSFTISAIDLNGAPGIITASSTNSLFQLSLDNTNWSGSVPMNYNSNNLANTTIYVRMPPQSLGSKTGSIVFSGGGLAAPPTVSLSGNAVLRPPTVYTNKTVINFGSINYSDNTTITFSLSGIKLIDFPAVVTVAATNPNFELSTDASNWGITTTVAYTTETLDATTIYVRYNPQSLGSATDLISFSAPGLSGAPTIAISGNSTIKIPFGLDPTNAENTSFTANWIAVPGATSYLLDVDGNPAFTTSNSTNVATWNLTSNYNATSGTSGNTAGGNSITVVGATLFNINSNGAGAIAWTNGSGTKYWQVLVATTGYSQIKVSSFQRAPNTGPRDFKLQYRVAVDGVWTDVAGGNVTAANNNTTGQLTNVPLPSECSNKPAVYLRWIMTSNISVAGGAIASNQGTFIRAISVSGNSDNYLPYHNYVVNGTSQIITGLLPAHTYYYRVRAVGSGQTSGYSSNGTAMTTAVTTWNGTQWTPSVPDEALNAFLTGPYNTNTNGAFTSNNLIIDAGGSITVASGTNVTVAGTIHNYQAETAFIVEDNANILQQIAFNDNTGNITVRRSAAMRRLDYVYWSSPVADQNLFAFSPQTLTNRFYEINENTNTFVTAAATTFVAAKGYAIRAPNNFLNAPAAPQTFNGVFTGTPNNGTITIPITNIGQGFNLIGNPYPSTISAAAFLAANPTIGTLYFWTHNSQVSGATNYSTVNGTGTTTAPGTVTPNGTIQTGQAFMVKTSAATNATFLNTMRVGNNAGQFFRNAVNENTADVNRIWLNISDADSVTGQMLTGYVLNATNDLDLFFDGKAIETSGTKLYNVINDGAFAIQGRALPFDQNDSVALGFKTESAGNFTIAIDHVDGLFSGDQDIFLKDELTGITSSIKNEPYTFVSETGTFNSRFKLVYQNTTLGTELPSVQSQNIIVYKNAGQLTINSGTNIMQEVKIYDIRGRLLFENNEVNAGITSIKNLNIANEVVIVKIRTNSGTVTKKVIL
ncbi:MAG: hypothetical protein PSV16_07600 [Flavobacterium sp.]|nr:hypothetical protein [Flavobacterium sp.]